MTKTKAAFQLTAQGLFEKFPRVYLWTVTFACVQADWEGSKRFSAFLKHLREVVGKGWGGVRVAELHREHGIHFHMLVTERLAVDLVRRVGRCHGIGRIHVCRARPEAGGYLAKYLSKQKEGPRHESGRKMRRWAAFGEVPRVRVSDLVNDRPMWIYRREKGLPFLNYKAEKILERAWDYGERAFTTAWWCLKGGTLQGEAAAIAIATGKYEARENGCVERLDVALARFGAQGLPEYSGPVNGDPF